MSTVATNPKTLLGFGTWEQIKDRFLLAAGTTYKAGATGGEATHKLTVSEIPSHKHDTYEYASGRVGTAASSGADGLQWGVHLSGTWTIDTGAVGGSAAHNNMPPYLSVYVWKRTA